METKKGPGLKVMLKCEDPKICDTKAMKTTTILEEMQRIQKV